jgi:hypothetical protein
MKPTNNDKYSKAKIYSIRSHQTDKFYIGSTTQELSKRMQSHQCHYKSRPFYVSSFEILKFPDVYIELLEEFPCENRIQLEKRESDLVRKNSNNIVNKLTKETKHSKYHLNSRDHVLDRVHELNKNEDYVKEHRKEFYVDNRTKMLKKAEDYRNGNKETINAKRRNKVTCECGQEISIGVIASHKRSAKHIKALNPDAVVVPAPKIQCQCGSLISSKKVNDHNKTQKHQAYVQSNS